MLILIVSNFWKGDWYDFTATSARKMTEREKRVKTNLIQWRLLCYHMLELRYERERKKNEPDTIHGPTELFVFPHRFCWPGRSLGEGHSEHSPGQISSHCTASLSSWSPKDQNNICRSTTTTILATGTYATSIVQSPVPNKLAPFVKWVFFSI